MYNKSNTVNDKIIYFMHFASVTVAPISNVCPVFLYFFYNSLMMDIHLKN